LCAASSVGNSVATFAVASTSGLPIPRSAASDVSHGTIEIVCVDPANNTWAFSSVTSLSNDTYVNHAAGSKSLTATLDRVRITADGNTFDAGTVNIQYQ